MRYDVTAWVHETPTKTTMKTFVVRGDIPGFELKDEKAVMVYAHHILTAFGLKVDISVSKRVPQALPCASETVLLVAHYGATRKGDMYNLTFEKVETEVRRLAAENPDYIYPSNGDGYACYYSPNNRRGKPACIFGQAYANLGVPDEALNDNEWRPAQDMLRDWLATDERLTRVQLGWIANVQRRQDDGNSWGEAVRRADAPND